LAGGSQCNEIIGEITGPSGLGVAIIITIAVTIPVAITTTIAITIAIVIIVAGAVAVTVTVSTVIPTAVAIAIPTVVAAPIGVSRCVKDSFARIEELERIYIGTCFNRTLNRRRL
jgi:hypothetical protein